MQEKLQKKGGKEMKKILSLLLALTMTFGVFSGLSVSAEETENVTEEVTKTYGLDNLNNEAGELKVAFIVERSSATA